MHVGVMVLLGLLGYGYLLISIYVAVIRILDGCVIDVAALIFFPATIIILFCAAIRLLYKAVKKIRVPWRRCITKVVKKIKAPWRS